LLSGLSSGVVAFGDFLLEPRERRLSLAGRPVDLNARYLDALLLLTDRPGELVTKDRFMTEVWHGVPVTDEALTQCIRTLRRALGDDAARPRFIETVPRHGYRFVAPVSSAGGQTNESPAPVQPSVVEPAPPPAAAGSNARLLLLSAAGLSGGAAAGLIGGVGYGLLAATNPPPGTGAISVVLVMTCLCLLVGILGGAGVGAGVALAARWSEERLFRLMLGGALGGMLVGALGRLIGLDAFTLLIGSRPVAITGGSEGLIIGAVTGATAWLSLRQRRDPQRAALAGGMLGGAAGLLIVLAGGQMMAGSLAVLAAAHPQAPLGSLLGGPVLPLWARLASGIVEGATFVGALSLAFALSVRSPPPRP